MRNNKQNKKKNNKKPEFKPTLEFMATQWLSIAMEQVRLKRLQKEGVAVNER